ncbi:hypothetical protein CGRA01v4_09679 [Colletotrichum graminicola]|nr:hypothetical protein CGRA01v4_09679 [Colletotrichum graminicola]
MVHASILASWKREKRYRLIATFWFVATMMFASLSMYLYTWVHFSGRFGSFQSGFRTELEAAKHAIHLQEKWFEGSPVFHDDGQEYVPEPEDGDQRPKYVGEPSKEIDHNWEQLHWGRFFLLSEEEARSAWGPDYTKFWAPREGGYVAALEVMHTVHCLDHIRKAFSPESYPEDSPIHGGLHRDHCIDHLRQTVMCNADLTPIPSVYYLGVGDNYINSDRPHTCRNFQRIRDWVSDRFNGTSRVAAYPGTVWNNEWINKDQPITD